MQAVLPAGAIVGTTDTQTLTNKTLTDPKLLLGGTNGTAGQVPMSQGAGLPPVWSNIGNAATATKLQTTRTISLSGDVSGSVSFDGSGDVSILTVVADDSHNHVIANVDGLQLALNGKLDYFALPLQGAEQSWYKIAELTTNIGLLANGLVLFVSGIGDYGDNKPGVDIVQVSTRSGVSVDVYEVAPTGAVDTTYGYINNAGTGMTELWVRRGAYNQKTGVAVGMAVEVTYGNLGNSVTEPAGITYVSKRKFYHSGNINTANAGTATKLQTARTLTIGNTGKSVDGSANVSWSLAEIGLPPSISVVGPTSAYVTTTAQLTITDFDDFDTYNVTASHGTISRSGATITYTAPGTVPGGGADTITIQRGTGQRTLTIQILPAAILPPTVTVTGAPSDVPGAPLIGTSAFQTVGVSDTHASTTWRVRRVADGAVVWESVNDTVNKTQITVPSGILQTNTQYLFEAIHNGATLGASAVGFIQATTKQQFAIIIGLVQVATGGGAGTYVRIDENFAPKTTDAAFFNNHPTYAGIIQQTIDGQSMIKIPKFWFKAGTVPSGTYAGKVYWMISDQPVSGFSVHPAFIGAGGAELAQIWVGKYQASASGGKLQSVTGAAPRVSMDFPTARSEAYARNVSGVSGFRLWSYYDLAAIQMLATIELGGLDMQSLVAQGRVSQSSAANVDASDVVAAQYRGITGLWGNVWQMVDGLKRNGGTWWRWQYNVPGSATTNDFATGYANTGVAAQTASGYPVTFQSTLLAAGIIVPATVDGTASNGSTGDYFWSNTNTDDRISYHGGFWSNGADAGLFSLYVDTAPSLALPNLGCRLAKV